MKRDMDLIRRIALETADLPYGETLDGLSDVSDESFFLHVLWMQEAGLIKAVAEKYLDDTPFAIVQRLTWDGCEFADSVRNDTIWRKAKENVLKPSMSFSFSILREWIKAEISQGLPTLRGGS